MICLLLVYQLGYLKSPHGNCKKQIKDTSSDSRNTNSDEYETLLPHIETAVDCMPTKQKEPIRLPWKSLLQLENKRLSMK